MKIILTSTGFENENTLPRIKEIIGIPFERVKMLVIPIARKYEYNK